MLMQNGPLNHSERLKSLNFTTPRWRLAAILKTVKSPYLCNKAYLSAITMTSTFSEFLPTRWRQKTAGTDMEQNYVTVTLFAAAIATYIA